MKGSTINSCTGPLRHAVAIIAKIGAVSIALIKNYDEGMSVQTCQQEKKSNSAFHMPVRLFQKGRLFMWLQEVIGQ